MTQREVVKSYHTEQLRCALDALRDRSDPAGRRAYQATRAELVRRVGEKEADRYLADNDQAIIQRALRILEARVRREPVQLSAPQAVHEYLRLLIGAEEREVFYTIWLDSQNMVIEADLTSLGTLTQTSVYPREMARRALIVNARSVILAHNHPSGRLEPSMADITLTGQLRRTLDLIDVQVLDHVLATAAGTLSFAERGLI